MRPRSMHFDDFCKNGIIEPLALNAILQGPEAAGFKILDATFVLPGAGAPPQESFLKKHIPGALFFDIEAVADRNSPLPHMLPTADEFSKAVTALGLKNSDFIVIYGQYGIVMGPARAWWTFRAFGHDRVCVLNGGLPAWETEGLPLASGVPVSQPGDFKARYRAELVRDKGQVRTASAAADTLILDARPETRFAGTVPEPRPGLRAGHIPGSRNIPCALVVDPQTGKMKPREALESLFAESGFAPGKPVIASCGSGVTACALVLALHHLGYPDIPVYDGAWSEWGLEGNDTQVSKL